jgi:hypothetical protein
MLIPFMENQFKRIHELLPWNWKANPTKLAA